LGLSFFFFQLDLRDLWKHRNVLKLSKNTTLNITTNQNVTNILEFDENINLNENGECNLEIEMKYNVL